ncbi:hypothetical protein TSUD_278100 [Trifolium subterraneum]|uniref:Reverse transcriptase zinc-binding domain-containing protein n=1 Tax=Trifolium subterraneum TaxID=3900 RepID=A0A2Z6MGT5_TRISU|nr:hypothetical protein TSUD_278100 [Trifolium subterraneum]
MHMLPKLQLKRLMHMVIFKSIWEIPTPSKVIAFSWQLLHDRVPTRDNLILRGIITQDTGGICVGCEVFPESSRHLFMHCKVAHSVWYEISKWLGVVIVMPSNLFHLFDYFSAAAFSKKSRKCFRLVWHSVLWSIWKARNNKVFNGIVVDLWKLWRW